MIKCADKKKYQQLFLSPLKTKATYTEFFDIPLCVSIHAMVSRKGSQYRAYVTSLLSKFVTLKRRKT